jgi:hypothetical protein
MYSGKPPAIEIETFLESIVTSQVSAGEFYEKMCTMRENT